MSFTETDPILNDLLPLDGLQNAVAALTAAHKLRARAATWESQLIAGLQLAWLSGGSIMVGQGCAFVQGAGLVKVGTAITITGLSLGASTWGHVYLYNNAGAAAVEVSTTAPSNYFGSAWQKTGDTTRRYLGSVRTDTGGNIINFFHDVSNSWMYYRCSSNGTVAAVAAMRVLNAGLATAETNVSCAAVIPITSRVAELDVQITATAGVATLGSSDDSVTGGAATYGHNLIAAASGVRPVRQFLDSSQQFSYWFDSAPSGGALYIDVLGYSFAR